MIKEELKTVSKSFSLTFIIYFIGYFVSLVVGVVIARIAGADVLGNIAVALSSIQILVFFTQFGINRGLLKYIPHFIARKDKNSLIRLISISLFFSLISSLIIIILYFIGLKDFIFYFFKNVDKISDVLKYLIFSLPFLSVLAIFNGILNGFQKPQHIKFRDQILYPVLRLLLFLLLLLYFSKLYSLVYATFLGMAISISYLGLVVYKKIKKINFSQSAKETTFILKEFFLFSLPLMFIALLDVVSNQVDMILIGHYLSSQLSGIYFIARKFGTLVAIPLSLFAPIVGASIAKFYAINDLKDINRIYQFSTKWIFIFSSILFISLFIEAKNILNIVGPEYIAGATALRIIAIGQLINSFVGPSGNTLIMANKGKILLLNNLIAILIGMGSSIYLIPKYSLIGVAISISIVFSLTNILSSIYITFVLKIYPMSIKTLFSRLFQISFILLINNILYIFIQLNNPLFSILYTGIVNTILVFLFSFILEHLSDEDLFILKTIKRKFFVL